MRGFLRFLLVLAVAAPAFAQPPGAGGGPGESRRDLEQQFTEAFAARQWEAASAALKKMMAQSPADPTPHYNLACVNAQQGDLPAAERALERAVELGFTSFDVMLSDTDLAPLREREVFKRIIAGAPSLTDAAIDKRLATLAKTFSKGYRNEKDPVLRLAYVSGFEEPSFRAARTEVERIAAWWRAAVLPADQPVPSRPDAWVVVIWPARKDWNEFARKTFGDRFGSIGGIYDHSRKELIAQDLGPTMRHEFLHVLHWRDMSQRRQMHPIWVQEGLCSLVEDISFTSDEPAAIKPLPSWRTNSLKRLQSATRVPSIRQILDMSTDKFSSSRPLANYAAARSLFLFLSDTGKLREWYGHYTTHFADDRSGGKSFEAVYGKPLAEVEKQWKAWLRALPEVAEVNRPGSAALPLAIDERGSGDGLPITTVYRSAGESGLKRGDVLTSIDGKAVRDVHDLARILGDYKPGAEVEIGYRRGKTTGAGKVKLVGRE